MERTAPERAPEELPDAPEADYRVAGGTLDRAARLEQENGQLKDRLRALEREVYAARKIVRRRRIGSAVQMGGVGATIASVLYLVASALGVADAPAVAPVMIIVGFVLGALAGYRWDRDDDFPPAPPARMY